jgi:hypothetical protein
MRPDGLPLWWTAIRADVIDDAAPGWDPPLQTPAAHQPTRPRCAFQESRRAILKQQTRSAARKPGAVIMNMKVREVTRRMRRVLRLMAGRNVLRRPVDRIEGAVLATLAAAFGVAVVISAIIGAHTYQSQSAAATGLHQVTAQLIQHGPLNGGLPHVIGQVEARWPAPRGGQRSGVLTTATTPNIADAPADARVQIWLNQAGQPAVPPAGQAVMIIYALIAGCAVAAVAAMGLLICYGLGRLVLDRRRLAAWESAWNLTGPRWTTRR